MHLRCLFELFLNRGEWQGDLHPAFEMHAALLEQLLIQLERMTGEDEESYVETKVRRYGGRPCDPDVSGADCMPEDFRGWMRDMGTTFAKTIPNLIDYPSRDYHELIQGYYHPRVTACINCLRTFLDDGGAADGLTVDNLLEERYAAAERRWVEEGYAVTDACCAAHLPLWKAAENAWRALKLLPLDGGLAEIGEEADASEVIDVFASFSEHSDGRKNRSWVNENPFLKKD